jgi:hypothetical protein
MMRASLKLFACAIFALLLSACASQAATIIKLDLGGVGPDLNYTGGVFGTLNTIDDNPAGLTGDQATNILFTSFLSGLGSTTGSYSLAGATATGAPTPLGGGVVTQNFSGGNFKIYNGANTLLLDVNLATSLLVGGGNGAFFNITNGTVVGGDPTITSQLVSNSMGMSMTLTNINGGGGPGLTINPANNTLNSFFADATKEITATQTPEPGAFLLALCVSGVPMYLRRRK